MRLYKICGNLNINDKNKQVTHLVLNDSDVFGNGETGMPCFQIQFDSNDEFLGNIDLTVEEAINLKCAISSFLEKIKCGIKPQYINEEYKENM